MPVHDSPVRLAVLGPPDLLVTALVTALGMHGVDAEWMPMRETAAGFPPDTPDVLIVDVDGHRPAGVIPGATSAGLTVLALASESSRDRVAAAIAEGATGWLRKSTSIAALAETVRAIAAGRICMSDEKRAEWLVEYRATSESVQADLDLLEQLSPREREVLCLLADGRRAAEIAGLLFLSITTVRSHIRSVLVKLGVNSQQHAADLYRDTSRRVARMIGTTVSP
ncbi:MAG: response regulator transcription factor [Pseudonocardia sp.]|nr:response regulator transcription factor [Pseudonocardia sp.]